MGETTGVKSAKLETNKEVYLAIAERTDRKERAENLFLQTFGKDAFELASALRTRIGRFNPILAFPRCIAKPDIRHASIYMAAENMRYSLLNFDWYSDLITKQNDYKRTLVDVPFGSYGKNLTLNVNNFGLVKGDLRDPRAADVLLDTQTVVFLIKTLQKKNPELAFSIAKELAPLSFFIDEIEKRDPAARPLREALADKQNVCCSLVQLHATLRKFIEGENQTSFDFSEISKKAASHIIRNGINVPGAQSIKYGSENGEVSISSVGGQVLYLIMFGMQAMIPNLIIAETGWDCDGKKIRFMYDMTVSFLLRNGLCEPAQVLVPSFHDAVAEPITGDVLTKLDYVVPMVQGITGLARPQERETITETMVESARSMLELMRMQRREKNEAKLGVAP